jgi:CHAD domain-containing protein
MKTRVTKKRGIVFRYYARRISSFQTNFRKARTAGYISDIHQMRVEMKKIMTLLSLFGKVGKKGSGFKRDAARLEVLFSKSGKVRESQLNLKYLRKFGIRDFEMLALKDKLEAVEKENLRDFLIEAGEFDEKLLDRVGSKVVSIVEEMSKDRFISAAKRFIRRRMEKISRLQSDLENEKNVHRIRKHLKAAATVVTTLYLVQPDDSSIKLLSDLKRTEKVIGSWHDRRIFLQFLDRLTDKPHEAPLQLPPTVEQFRVKIIAECEELFLQFSQSRFD